jgi:hypothetical protein
MADSTQALAFQEALRGVTQQQAVLESIRGRAATLLAIASVSTSFLGGVALNKERPRGLAWIPVLLFILVGVLAILILLPRRGWIFRLGARELIRDYVEADPPAALPEMHRDLALHLERHYQSNERRLRTLFWLFQAASALLVGEVVVWLLVLAQG